MTSITLLRPVEFQDQHFDAIDIDEPTVGGIEIFEDTKALGKSELAATIALLAYEAGWPVEAIRKIHITDFVTISEAFAPFMQRTPGAIGEGSVPTSPVP